MYGLPRLMIRRTVSNKLKRVSAGSALVLLAAAAAVPRAGLSFLLAGGAMASSGEDMCRGGGVLYGQVKRPIQGAALFLSFNVAYGSDRRQSPTARIAFILCGPEAGATWRSTQGAARGYGRRLGGAFFFHVSRLPCAGCHELTMHALHVIATILCP